MDPLMNPTASSPAYPQPQPLFPQPQISATNNLPESPYHDMIIAAITALKERDGSSRLAINRYIQNVYTGNLPLNHPTLLTCHLKRMKSEGALVMVKRSYALPGSDLPPPPPSDFLSPSPKPRGRPPKPKTLLLEPNSEPAVTVPFPNPQQPNAETMLVPLGSVDGPKRGRGRPKLVRNGPEKPVSEKRPRGRPRKDAFTPATQVDAQHLTNKLVHFQSRVKHAVDMVRPYFTSEANPDVYGALQELDLLANTDMTAPPQPPPPSPPPPQAQPPAAVAHGFENSS